MLLLQTPQGPVVERDGQCFAVPSDDWDELFDDADLEGRLTAACRGPAIVRPEPLLAPIGGQEIWAAGVTYWRSRTARMEESRDHGGGSFYDRVYEAERPELFLKATAHRVAAPGGTMRLRCDSKWIVPEPELTLVVNSRAQIVGYTIGNDLSCRDIEGDNPLYLPQAKTFDGCAAIGPGLLVTRERLPQETEIRLEIRRGSPVVWGGSTTLAQLRRTPESLVEYLYRESSFPRGCFLMTGTGIVPPDDFSLQPGDEMAVTIAPIGTLTNSVQPARC
jgi:2-dehydro-3-deoxy-D-arabinonate dehydratase